MGAEETYTNLQAAMAELEAGDTLIIRDGTYIGSTNMISNAYHPPTGAEGSWVTIQAEHSGSVIFDGQNTNNMFYIDGNTAGNLNYLKFSGIIWGRSSSTDVVFIQGNTTSTHNSHIYFSQCGFYDGGSTQSTSYNGLNIRHTDYALVEDCYAWGELYYGMLMEMDSCSVFRRCVVRYDIHRGPRGGGIGVYSSSDMEVQNCIVIDCDQDATYTGVTEAIYAFAYPTTDGPSTNIYNRGNIALNLIAATKITSSLISANGGGSGFTFNDVVYWDTSGGFWDRVTASIYTNCIFGKSGGGIISEGIAGGGTLTNSIILDNTTYGSSVTASNYNVYYGNGTDFHNTSDGDHDYCAANSNAFDPETNGLKYLIRIEPGSTLSTAGSGSGRLGPRILYQIGATGTFYGETGYNTESAISLWPFPNEDIIKVKFASYAGNTNGEITGLRGFAATGKQLNGTDDITLTSYIWEYLGNQMPSDIYNPYCTLSGTLATGADEEDIYNGGGTIILTLTGDTWVADDGTFAAQRQNIIDSITSVTSEATGWNAEVRDKAAVTELVRTSDTVATWTVGAQIGFDIEATDGPITAKPPATALMGAEELTASPTFSIGATVVGTGIAATYSAGGSAAVYGAGGITLVGP